jgi:hypothetical protein
MGLYEEGNNKGYEKSICRPATPAEIESHLKSICDEKYIGKKVKSLANHIDKLGIIIENPRIKYYESSDELWYEDSKTFMQCVYKQGKFAEIISEKKKLPKTRDEFAELLHKFQDDAFLPFPTMDVDVFLNEYEL